MLMRKFWNTQFNFHFNGTSKKRRSFAGTTVAYIYKANVYLHMLRVTYLSETLSLSLSKTLTFSH